MSFKTDSFSDNILFFSLRSQQPISNWKKSNGGIK